MASSLLSKMCWQELEANIVSYRPMAKQKVSIICLVFVYVCQDDRHVQNFQRTQGYKGDFFQVELGLIRSKLRFQLSLSHYILLEDSEGSCITCAEKAGLWASALKLLQMAEDMSQVLSHGGRPRWQMSKRNERSIIYE